MTVFLCRKIAANLTTFRCSKITANLTVFRCCKIAANFTALFFSCSKISANLTVFRCREIAANSTVFTVVDNLTVFCCSKIAANYRFCCSKISANFNRYLLRAYTYVRTYAYMFAYPGFRCSILYESYTVQCIRIQLPEPCSTMRAPRVLSGAFSLNASARHGACKRSLFKSKVVSPENQRWLPKQ